MTIPPLSFPCVNLLAPPSPPAQELALVHSPYRVIAPFADMRTEAAVLRDGQRPVTERLSALENLGRALGRSHEDGEDFLYGVTALFDLAARPRAAGDAAVKLRHRALLLLDETLVRKPPTPLALEQLMHAFLEFQSVTGGDLRKWARRPEGTQGHAIASAVDRIDDKLSDAIRHCSPAVKRYRAEVSHLRTPRRMKTLALRMTGAAFTSCALWSGLFHLLSLRFLTIFTAVEAGLVLTFGVLLSVDVLHHKAREAAWLVRHRLAGPTLQPYPLESGAPASPKKLLTVPANVETGPVCNGTDPAAGRKPVRLLAKSIYEDLANEGYDERSIIALATELIAEVTARLRK